MGGGLIATVYNIWFGESGDMTLRSEGQVGITWAIPSGELVYGTVYQWRIDSIDEYGTTYGDVWEFTAVVLAPPVNNAATLRRLVAAARNRIYYEDI